jgi:ribosomal protein L7Ae-like RNA K-turn-binding protein
MKEKRKILSVFFSILSNNIIHLFYFYRLKKKKKKRMKVYVAAPGQHNWPSIPDDIQNRLLTILNEYLNEDKLKISLKRSRKKTQIKHPIKQHLAIGLRCVMRCLKQKQCSLILVCTSLTPIILTKPILLLSQMYSIPSIRLKNLSTILTKIFHIPHCSTIGFKLSCQENEQLQNLVDNLLQIINGSKNQSLESSSIKFIPGKMISPYQNPKRISDGIQKKKKK